MRASAGLALALVLAALGGCGSGNPHPAIRSQPSRPPRANPNFGAAKPCIPPPGAGVVGACVERQHLGAAPRPQSTSRALIPDVSEYQACRVYSPIIWRAYEAGTDRQDFTARCHAEEGKRHGWHAAYFFGRPPGYYHAPSCGQQARRFYQIVHALGGVYVFIDDAEVPLPHGFVRCVEAEWHRLAPGKPTVTYGAPGTISGGPISEPLWVATYGPSPGCLLGICRSVAWQFADAFNCRGVVGDCSFDEGITRLGVTDRPALQARIRTLRRVLAAFGCRRREHLHEALGPRCRRWKAEGDAAHARLASA